MGRVQQNDEPEVIAVSDTGEKEQWGRHRLFFRDGGKWTLRTKMLSIALGIVFCCLITFQCILDSGTLPFARAKKTLSVDPTLQESTTRLETYMVSENTSTKTKKKGPARLVRLSPPQVVARPRAVNIPPGAMAKGRLVSGASKGLVRAELTSTLSQNGNSFLEEGTVLVGQGSSTEDRLNIAFNQAVFRDGTIAPIQAHACDKSDQIVGLKGSKIGNKALNIIGSIGLGFVGGFSEGLQDTQGQQGVAIRSPSIKNALLNATGTTALEQSQNLMSDLKDKKPVIEVPAGSEICIIFGGSR